MAGILPHQGSTRLELIIIVVFAALFAWISIGFWEAIGGLYVLARRVDRFSMHRSADVHEGIDDPHARSAILYPVANEDVTRVFAGIQATYESLEKTGQLDRFDFFILSDSSDPDKWVEEEVAWADFCRIWNANHRVYYRHRRVNLKRKSGNIADFCRRWGKNYRYMVVMDADSIMAGRAIVQMVRSMELHPEVGILQSAPMAVNRETAIARIQQFANHVYGPLFTAGLHFLQLGDSHFWGHNAILRVEPFMKHCGLAQFPGNPPRGGYILSHDFVEAAFMRRGGWEVWLAHDLKGSYEEVPPNLLEELKRERRWCQGNLQHLRLLFTKGLFSAHRALFLHGAMSYVSALLWFIFLSLSTAEAISEAFRTPVYFPAQRVLFPSWPVWYPQWAMALLSMTAILLFVPKLLSVLLIMLKQRGPGLYGGIGRLLASMVAEVILSAIFAPIRMLFHSKFVFITLLGRQVGWTAQRRVDLETGWSEALRFHWAGTALGLIWGSALFLFNRSFLWWISPVILPLIFSIPLSMLSSKASVGQWLKKIGIFLIPEEVDIPHELQFLHQNLQRAESISPLPVPREQGFILAVVDPSVNSLHRSLSQRRKRPSVPIRSRREKFRDKALALGPGSLSAGEKKQLLGDPELMGELHRLVWEINDPKLAEKWGIPF